MGSMLCKKCGSPIQKDFSFCTQCGAPVQASSISQQTSPDVQFTQAEPCIENEQLKKSLSNRLKSLLSTGKQSKTENIPLPKSDIGAVDSVSASCYNDDPETIIFDDEGQALEDDSSTTVLCSGQPKIRIKRMTNDVIYEAGFPLVVGKGSAADVIVSGNSAISRKHAQIDDIAGQAIIQDLGSTNGTYVNGKRLENRETAILKINTVFQLADEEFLYLG